jgi:hypothetical protein
MTSSAPVCKFMSCRFSCSARDLVYHQYGICRMYSEENPQDFRLPVPCLYSGERVMLLLSAEAFLQAGLGLRSVKERCDKLQGGCDITSKEGQGTVIHFWFPA